MELCIDYYYKDKENYIFEKLSSLRIPLFQEHRLGSHVIKAVMFKDYKLFYLFQH